MKVDFSASVNVYRKNLPSENLTKVKDSVAGRSKTDTMDFTRGSSVVSDKTFLSTKSSIQRDINAPADSKRLEQLTQSIKEGSYKIPTKDLVNSLIEP